MSHDMSDIACAPLASDVCLRDVRWTDGQYSFAFTYAYAYAEGERFMKLSFGDVLSVR